MAVFVTVGSTSFDDLIKSVCSADVIELLNNKGFKKITLQIGRGSATPEESSDIHIDWFRYKDSISEDIKSADLIIGHAGAGTILESLIEQKPLITVLNENLMDNHQSELADQMEKEGYLLSCHCSNLLGTLNEFFSGKSLRPYISEPDMFPAFLEDVMGFR